MLVDINTGEIITRDKKRVKVASTAKTVGVDTRYPSECTDENDLTEALVNLDAHLHHKPELDYAYLTDSVLGHLLTVSEVSLLHLIGVNLSGWNYCMTTTTKLQTVVAPANLARTLKSLQEKKAIRVTHRDKPFRGDITIMINPKIAFKGGHWFRNKAVERWYDPCSS